MAATLVNNQGRPHDWRNKTHLRQFTEGFSLYPTVQLYIVKTLIDQHRLHERLRWDVYPSLLDRQLKLELGKANLAGQLMSAMCQEKPLLYRSTRPTELQITCFLKQNTAMIRNYLKSKIQSMPSSTPEPLPITESA